MESKPGHNKRESEFSKTCLQADTANHEKVDALLCLDVPSNDATHRMSQGQIYMSEIESGTVSKKDLVTSNDNIINMSSSMVSKEIKNTEVCFHNDLSSSAKDYKRAKMRVS